MFTAQVASMVAAVFLIGSHCLIAAPQTGDESQTIAQSGADPVPIIPSAVNLLKANLAERSSSTAESEPKGFWIQAWNDPHQSFQWSVQVPRAGEYSIDVLVSGAPGSLIEIAGPENRLSVEIPEGNDHWGNNWNKIAVPGAHAGGGYLHWLESTVRGDSCAEKCRVIVAPLNPVDLRCSINSPRRNRSSAWRCIVIDVDPISRRRPALVVLHASAVTNRLRAALAHDPACSPFGSSLRVLRSYSRLLGCIFFISR